MKSKPSVQPPRLASWLVNLFAASEQAEAMQGDLIEEFSELALKSGVASARRWYMRQSVRAIVYLILAAFRDAPWLIAGTVFGGVLLLHSGNPLIESAIVALIRTNDSFFYAHVDAYLFCLNNGILIGRVLLPLLVGCVVAFATKDREIVATITLGLVCMALTAMQIWVLWAGGIRPESPYLLPFFVHVFVSPVAILLGGGLVREMRST